MGTIHDLPEISGSSDDPLEISREAIKKWGFIRKRGEAPFKWQFKELSPYILIQKYLPQKTEANTSLNLTRQKKGFLVRQVNCQRFNPIIFVGCSIDVLV